MRLCLDARPDRLDLRDRTFQLQLGSLPAAWPSDEDVARLLPTYAARGLVLDQGQDGACTGFGLAAVINYLLFLRNVGADALRTTLGVHYRVDVRSVVDMQATIRQVGALY